ncbi:MAG: HhH-GPD superfamily base excision repair protein [Rubrobacteraceae bacterium]|jgi:DNA-3-methyladenine glycosylase II|nr:HhH-GPD superfamily base excision repair protein [Rubrobacteraceae bacterium]
MNDTSSDYDSRGDAGFLHLLSCGDATMASLVEAIGPLSIEERRRGRPDDAYGALIRSIVGQQLSTAAARTIYGRLTALFDHRPPTPAELLAADEETLRACGLSRPKISYLRDLARHVLEDGLDLPRLRELPDDEVASRLVAVKGIGQWSADMFLIFHLGRADVLPVGDLGIRRAVQRTYDLQVPPDEATLRTLAVPWRPHRTLACFYLWQTLE